VSQHHRKFHFFMMNFYLPRLYQRGISSPPTTLNLNGFAPSKPFDSSARDADDDIEDDAAAGAPPEPLPSTALLDLDGVCRI
jgi:hypothetical protein